MRRLCCALLVSLVVVLGAPPAVAEGEFSPPVAGPIVDRFRPPATPYGPGNRGIDYATSPGEEVRAAGAGEVVFAGRVGRSRHVVVLHPNGLRTSYSFLAEVDVRRGDHVERGDVVGRAGAELHFGVRAGDDRYLDPVPLLEGVRPDVHLVPIRRSAASERRSLLRSLVGLARSTVDAGAAGVAWARGQAADTWATARARLQTLALTAELLSYYLHLPGETLELAWRSRLFLAAQDGCTPASVAPPGRRRGRRIALLVGGLGSSAGHAAVLDVDTQALGYADADVAQFSYRGGQAPGPRHLDGVPTTTYGADDSEGDLRVAADRFRDLLRSVRAAHPGVPVDVIAHSQGGLVVRAALGNEADALDPRLPAVEHVVTLGSPHHGADLATAGAALGTSTVGQLVQAAVGAASGGAVDPSSQAAAQLAETSDFIADLEHRPLPAGARVTSIAASGDLVVPGLQAGLAGATNVLVPLEGLHAHDQLPASPLAARELALALADRGPTCRSLAGDLLLAGGISLAEDGFGGAALFGGLWADQRVAGANHPKG
ncbi:MAG: peptidase family protein [Actinomycetia bacterium]|nr:peptidase family protein [Actinomycetes bacterium]